MLRNDPKTERNTEQSKERRSRSYINPKSKKFPDAEPYISRGLFKSYKYGIIHSDVNGDLGTGRKADDIIC
ncbi:MAG: hypothetical protein BAJALOKI2v1_20064 [Promethearchaeota archaeon]|nr:MAG: hypothetical protein BAJALOKI2v1_20064 [Candidatus Lokiarchaeota archaeon]